MPVLIKVSQNQIKDAKSFGKFYGHVVSTKTMTYAELCKHMAEHNSVYGEDVCLGVANKLQAVCSNSCSKARRCSSATSEPSTSQ